MNYLKVFWYVVYLWCTVLCLFRPQVSSPGQEEQASLWLCGEDEHSENLMSASPQQVLSFVEQLNNSALLYLRAEASAAE